MSEELRKLVENWRKKTYEVNGVTLAYDGDFLYGRERCADELEAALARVEQPILVARCGCTAKGPWVIACDEHKNLWRDWLTVPSGEKGAKDERAVPQDNNE